MFIDFISVLGSFKIFRGFFREFLKYPVAQLKTDSAVIFYNGSESLDKIGVVVARMKLNKFHLFSLTFGQKIEVVGVTVAYYICGNLFGKKGFACTGSSS